MLNDLICIVTLLFEFRAVVNCCNGLVTFPSWLFTLRVVGASFPLACVRFLDLIYPT